MNVFQITDSFNFDSETVFNPEIHTPTRYSFTSIKNMHFFLRLEAEIRVPKLNFKRPVIH